MGRNTFLLTSVLLLAASPAPAQADAPLAAGAAVRRVVESLRTNDRATFLATLADDYDYDGLKKADVNPFGPLGILYDQLFYRVLEVLPSGAGAATALVDTDFRGRVNLDSLGNGEPDVVGASRLWIEVRRQTNGAWLVSALRPVRLRYFHPPTFSSPGDAQIPFTLVQGVLVNGASSLIVPPGATLTVTGETQFGPFQNFAVGPTFASISLDLNINAGFEPWTGKVPAPTRPGRYYLDTVSFVSAHLPVSSLFPQGRYVLSWDEVTLPVVVQ